MTLKDMAIRLNDAGVRTLSGAEFHPMTVKRILDEHKIQHRSKDASTQN
jgi:hypothetical protein